MLRWWASEVVCQGGEIHHDGTTVMHLVTAGSRMSMCVIGTMQQQQDEGESAKVAPAPALHLRQSLCVSYIPCMSTWKYTPLWPAALTPMQLCLGGAGLGHNPHLPLGQHMLLASAEHDHKHAVRHVCTMNGATGPTQAAVSTQGQRQGPPVRCSQGGQGHEGGGKGGAEWAGGWVGPGSADLAIPLVPNPYPQAT